MSRTMTVMMAGLLLALPTIAHAQDRATERSYCAELSTLYDRYIGPSQADRRVNRRTLEGEVGKAKCAQGETAAGIPMLERKLVDAKIELPARRS